MYCKQCGNFIDERKDKFCMNCGLPIEEQDIQQVEQVKENTGTKILYYASEALSILFLALLFLSIISNEIDEAASDILYFIAMVNLHKIMVSKLIKDGQVINKVSIILEKLSGLRANLFREPSYIYDHARKRNTNINVAIMIICLIIGKILGS